MDWLRIMPDMFDNAKFGRLYHDKQVGSVFPLVWARVILAVSKCSQGGMIIMSNAVIYDLDTLSKDVGSDTETVEGVLEAMRAGGMIEKSGNVREPKKATCIETKVEQKADEDSVANVTNVVISYLNERLGSRYRPDIEKNRRLVAARMNEKRTIEDFKAVIDVKCEEWKGTEMEKYLRPETLFSNKFESYLNQPVANTVGNRLKKSVSKEDVFGSFMTGA